MIGCALHGLEPERFTRKDNLLLMNVFSLVCRGFCS